MDGVSVFDIECDGLNPTKIHCLSVYDGKSKHTTNYKRMKSFFEETNVLVGHNIIRFDIPVVSHLLGINVKSKLVDTLAISWYLFPDRRTHSLADWGEEFGVPKPPIDDWENLSVEEYIHRCNEDVRINTLLWKKQWKLLMKIYKDEKRVWKFIDYLMFKMDCAREQERSKWKLDVDRCREGLDNLLREKDQKIEELRLAMPPVPRTQSKSRPAKPFKKDGSKSSIGIKWFELLHERGLPEDYQGEVEVITGYDDPNPNSVSQKKNWLYSLGWKPETFKYLRDKETGDVKSIPQITLEHGGGICPSVRKLYSVEPSLALLEGLGILSHRIGILNGFLDNADNEGYVRAEIQGITNTLRFKHAVCVNLPGVFKPYGELIRGCLIARDGNELCGSDMSGLEDRLKQHYIYPYDPEYVKEMLSDDYDPHLALALQAGAVTNEQAERYKSGEDTSIKEVRHTFKQGNYALTIAHVKSCEFRGTL